MSPGDLDKLLGGLPVRRDPRILVGLEEGDDAGVFLLSQDLALVQTVDIITPVVDDPRLYGQVAAANALSDVYAMGGTPLTALAVVCVPAGGQEQALVRQILEGALEKIHEAGAFLVGGHTVEDPELKIGFAVTGTVHPSAIWNRAKARPGDALVLTKALGCGIVSTALKAGLAAPEDVAAMTRSMTFLNRGAAEILARFAVHAVTDVTGFGLGGHGCEMARRSSVAMLLDLETVPLLPGARAYASMGLVPAGARRNRDFYREWVDAEGDLMPEELDILFDPQTSGGLLAAVGEGDAERVVRDLRESGHVHAAVVGKVAENPAGRLVVRAWKAGRT